ncbi:class I SAM-dependent methyltransferase [Streptomyces sp. NPDC059786]|uniref:class I SAM-dependent methyltransferase n=1 Tax=Streptomyces sp. NPDC059786 TaxID=3346946 RepID=UPI0036658733
MPDLRDRQLRPELPISAASEWDTRYRLNAGISEPVTEAEVGLFLKHVGVQPGQMALDAGCGTGAWARWLSRWGLGVLAMDVSPVALALARQQGHDASLHYVRHDFDARAIPRSLAPSTLDLILCRDTLPYLDRERFLVDARRWLAPTGRLVVTVPVAAGARAASPWLAGLTREQIRALGAGWATRQDYTVTSTHACVVLGNSAETPRR